MNFVTIMGIALGLAMDAFAVSLACSAALGEATNRQTFRLSFHFFIFHVTMPLVGWLAGMEIVRFIRNFDHWVALALLLFVGGKMVRESFRPGTVKLSADPTRGWSLVLLSVATSIDALAIGLSFAMLKMNVWYPVILIGLVAAGMTILGMKVGNLLGRAFGRKMELVGGMILIAIGFKIFAEHLLR